MLLVDIKVINTPPIARVANVCYTKYINHLTPMPLCPHNMYSAKQIFELKLLKKPNGKPYKSLRSVSTVIGSKFKPKKTRYGYGYVLTDKDLITLQNFINKHNGIWNTPTTIKSNTSGKMVKEANQQEI